MSWRRKLLYHQFRDVSPILQWLRNFLLGRTHHLHIRFADKLAPRSIPKPEIPRAPEYKYSNQWYYKRHYFDSAHPPVVAPVAEGPSIGHDKYKPVTAAGLRPDYVDFPCLPMPGKPYWWDHHSYYECVADRSAPPPRFPKNPLPCPDWPEAEPPPSTCPPGNPPCPVVKAEDPYPPPCPRPKNV